VFCVLEENFLNRSAGMSGKGKRSNFKAVDIVAFLCTFFVMGIWSNMGMYLL